MKKMVCIRLDMEVLAWLKRKGPGYQTLIQSILRDYKEGEESRRSLEKHKRRGPAKISS